MRQDGTVPCAGGPQGVDSCASDMSSESRLIEVAARPRPKSPVVMAAVLAWTVSASDLVAGLLPHPPLVPTPEELGHLARVRALLATSTVDHPNPVHIVFYGQSITLQPWWVMVRDEIIRMYPAARLTIENKAVSGLQDWALSRTVIADLIPIQPDLVIFHAYGNGAGTESLLADLRTKTTTDVLLQSDPIGSFDRLDEPTDASRIAVSDLAPYRNYVTLPAAAQRHDVCLARIRDTWKDYLGANKLPPTELLSDGNVHLNDDGDLLMAECVLAYLKPSASSAPLDPWRSARMQTATIGRDVFWRGGVLECSFTGSVVSVATTDPLASRMEVWVDGQRPSELPELYGFSPVSPTHFANWPALTRVGSEQPLVEEEWTMTPHDFSADSQRFAFSVRGSVTGPDGEGTNTQRFVSRSGRVVIESGDHWLDRAVYWSGGRPVPAGYEAHWRVDRHFLEELSDRTAPASGAGTVTRVLQGLSDGPHRLRLVAVDGIGGDIDAVHVGSPGGNAAIKDIGVDPADPEFKLSLLRSPRGLCLGWPMQSTSWRLEASSLAGTGAVWETVAETEIVPWSGWRTVTLGSPSSARFFRLVVRSP